VVDSLKLLQLAMDTPIGLLYQASYDIKDDNHVVMTITMRDTARHPDWPGPELDIAMAQGDWVQRIKTSLVNPAPPVATPPHQPTVATGNHGETAVCGGHQKAA
jgi:hypothetical protein